jgi:hypothetical protein
MIMPAWPDAESVWGRSREGFSLMPVAAGTAQGTGGMVEDVRGRLHQGCWHLEAVGQYWETD